MDNRRRREQGKEIGIHALAAPRGAGSKESEPDRLNMKCNILLLAACALGLFAAPLVRAQGILVLSNTNEPVTGTVDELYGARIIFVPGPTPGGYELTGVAIMFGDNPNVDFTNVAIQIYSSNSPLNPLDNYMDGISEAVPVTAGLYLYPWPTNLFLPRQLEGQPVTYYTLFVHPGPDEDPGNLAETDELNVVYTNSTNYTANAGWTFLPANSSIESTLGRCAIFNIFATVLPPPVLYPIHLRDAAALSDGSFQFGFTNSPGFSFTTYATTNLALPVANWFSVGNPLNVASNYYQYNSGPGVVTSPSFPKVFFRVTSP
jgi:hypothetical protein